MSAAIEGAALSAAMPTAVPTALPAQGQSPKPDAPLRNLLDRLRGPVLALVVPLAALALWHFATANRPYSLVPPPAEVWLALRDMAFGGINDDAFSATLWTHLWASLSRVYGGFALAAAAALPLGLMIGRVPLARALLDPVLQILRPIPVTAWLPLAMILFGLGARSAFFLVFLGAFYPILVNTVFGVRSVEPRGSGAGNLQRVIANGVSGAAAAAGVARKLHSVVARGRRRRKPAIQFESHVRKSIGPTQPIDFRNRVNMS